MRKLFILGLLIISGIIAFAHAVVYETVITIVSILFGVSLSLGVLDVLRLIFIFLSVSFTIATFISFKYNNRVARFFYRFAARWTGFLIYFFFAGFTYGLLNILFTAIASIFVLSVIGAGLVTVAFFVGVYGLFHGNDTKITKVNLALLHIPEKWKNRKVVWISDIHLGHVRGTDFLKKICDTIMTLDPDIVFIGGDLYDGLKIDATKIIEPLRALIAGSQRKIYFVMGNHEEFHPDDAVRYMQAVKDIGIRVLEDELVEVEGVQIIGVDHGHADHRVDFDALLKKIFVRDQFDPKRPSILLKHEPRDLDISADAGITLQISGHTHQGQIFPVSLITRLVFKSYDYGLKKYGSEMQVFTSSGVGTWGPPLRVGTKSEIVLFEFT